MGALGCTDSIRGFYGLFIVVRLRQSRQLTTLAAKLTTKLTTKMAFKLSIKGLGGNMSV